jgi:hypothetical protein
MSVEQLHTHDAAYRLQFVVHGRLDRCGASGFPRRASITARCRSGGSRLPRKILLDETA